MNSDRVFFVTTITMQRLPIFRRETTAKLLIDTLAHCGVTTSTCCSRPRNKFLSNGPCNSSREVSHIGSISAALSGSRVSRIIGSETGKITNAIANTSG